ncbi:hypothetical protein [uncultured Hymenobacter sp.]|uniref:hypothetical protein n=1 Tax=uncultured Hymenobacter sp. TaxID=170016 RepID=UPI0035CAB611
MNKLLLLTLPLALLLGCKKDDPDPVDQLPPATQTGANTLGCLINGQPWTPQGNDGSSNYRVVYDRALGGAFDLRAYRYQQKPTDNYQYMILFATRLYAPKSYSFRDSLDTEAYISDRMTGCELTSRDKAIYRRGTLTITRLDLQAGIISGTFDFVLAKPGCDTVRVTQGRFDKRL